MFELNNRGIQLDRYAYNNTWATGSVVFRMKSLLIELFILAKWISFF